MLLSLGADSKCTAGMKAWQPTGEELGIDDGDPSLGAGDGGVRSLASLRSDVERSSFHLLAGICHVLRSSSMSKPSQACGLAGLSRQWTDHAAAFARLRFGAAGSGATSGSASTTAALRPRPNDLARLDRCLA